MQSEQRTCSLCHFFICQKIWQCLALCSWKREEANHCWMYKKMTMLKKNSMFMKYPWKNPNTLNYQILFRYFRDISFFLNIAKKILENFAKNCKYFFWDIAKISCMYTILGHYPDLSYSDCIRRCSFILFPKSFQILSLNCKILLFLFFCVSFANVQSYYLTFMFLILIT